MTDVSHFHELLQSNPQSVINSIHQSIDQILNTTQHNSTQLLLPCCKTIEKLGLIEICIGNHNEPLINNIDSIRLLKLFDYIMTLLNTSCRTLQSYSNIDKLLIQLFEFMSVVYVYMIDNTLGSDLNGLLWSNITTLLSTLIQQYCTYKSNVYVIRSCVNLICDLLDRHILNDTNAKHIFDSNIHIINELIDPNNQYLVPRQIQRLSNALSINTFPHNINHKRTNNQLISSGTTDDTRVFCSDESRHNINASTASLQPYRKPSQLHIQSNHEFIDLTDADEPVSKRIKTASNKTDAMFNKLMNNIQSDATVDKTKYLDEYKYNRPNKSLNPFQQSSAYTSNSNTPTNTLTPESLQQYQKQKQKTLFDFHVTNNAAIYNSHTNTSKPTPLISMNNNKPINTLTKQLSTNNPTNMKLYTTDHTTTNDNINDLHSLESQVDSALHYHTRVKLVEKNRMQAKLIHDYDTKHKAIIQSKLNIATPIDITKDQPYQYNKIESNINNNHHTNNESTHKQSTKSTGPKSDVMKQLEHDRRDPSVRRAPKQSMNNDKTRKKTPAELHLERVRQQKLLKQQGLIDNEENELITPLSLINKTNTSNNNELTKRTLIAESTSDNTTATNQPIDVRPVLNHRTAQQIADDQTAAKKAEQHALKVKLRRSITTLHKNILKWNYAELNTAVYQQLKPLLHKPVLTYVSDQHYQKVYLALLLEETRANIHQSVEQLQSYITSNPLQQPFDNTDIGAYEVIAVGNYTIRNDVHIIDVVQKYDINNSDDSKQQRNKTVFTDHDLVLLYPAPLVGDTTLDTLSSASITTLAHITLAKDTNDTLPPSYTLSKQSKSDKLIQYKLQCSFGTDARGQLLKQQVLQRNSEWCCIRLTNLKTVHREYRALMSIDLIQSYYIDMVDL